MLHRAVLFVRYLLILFRARFLCPRGHHGDHWQYFGTRSRVCRCCHREEWYYPHGSPQWQKPSGNSAWGRTATGPAPLDGDGWPTNGG